MVPNYNVNVDPQSGSGAYGSVPGLIGLPPNLYSQTAGQFPAVNQGGTNATNFIQSETAGQVAPETMNLLQQKAAEMGVAGGSPGSGFSANNFTESLGLDSQNLAHQGVADYLSFITGQGNQMTDPNLAFGVAQQNAVDQAAPDPSAAAAQLNANLNQGRSAGGGGVIPFSGGPSAPISSTPMTQGWNDPSNPPVMYGPQGGGGQPAAPTVDPSVTQYASAGGGYDPFSWQSALGLGLGTGLGSMGGSSSPGSIYMGSADGTQNDYTGGNNDYFSSGQAYDDTTDLFSDTGS